MEVGETPPPTNLAIPKNRRPPVQVFSQGLRQLLGTIEGKLPDISTAINLLPKDFRNETVRKVFSLAYGNDIAESLLKGNYSIPAGTVARLAEKNQLTTDEITDFMEECTAHSPPQDESH